MHSVIALLIATSCQLGQAQPNPEFEVATIKRNVSGDSNRQAGILPSGQFAARNMTVAEIPQFAFDTREESLLNVPNWARSERYDLVGRAQPGANEETIRPMLRTFLTKEMQLATHNEERARDVLVLTAGKDGAKLQRSSGEARPNCRRPPGAPADGQQHLECVAFTMKDLAEALPRLARAYVDREVVDQTGISGAFDLRIDWTPKNLIGDGGLTMQEALEKQLGLKLVDKKLSMSVVVIDRLTRPSD